MQKLQIAGILQLIEGTRGIPDQGHACVPLGAFRRNAKYWKGNKMREGLGTQSRFQFAQVVFQHKLCLARLSADTQ